MKKSFIGALRWCLAKLGDANQEWTLQVSDMELLPKSRQAEAYGLVDFASGLAHEINNPLAVIHGRSQLIKMQVEAGQVSESDIVKWANLIEAYTDRMTKIIKDMRAYARDPGKIPPESRDLREIAGFSMGFIEQKAKDHAVQVRFRPGEDCAQVECNPVLLAQAIFHLVTNAVESSRLVKRPLVGITVQVEGSLAVLEVTDNGPPLKVETESRMFHPFYTSKEVGEGTGMGLPVCLGIVTSHGGDITYQKVLGGFNRFKVTLPLAASKASSVAKTDLINVDAA